MLTLAIESSCDDTAAAVLVDGRTVLSSIVSSQFDVHARYGGIVPELASRRHIETVWPVVQEALTIAGVELTDLDLIAATQGPGLIGSLLVGFTFAKGLALVLNIPCVGVDHMAGHLLSPFLEEPAPQFPYIALIASGGNTSLYRVGSHTKFRCLGRTRDDAAGEAFDKVAKLLDLGYPGGPIISRMAMEGDPAAITSVVNFVNGFRRKDLPLPVADICASFQEAVVEVLVSKTIRAARHMGTEQVVLGGGVASNLRLRQAMAEQSKAAGLQLFVPAPVYCTDNAAMIGLAGFHRFQRGEVLDPDADVYSRPQLH